jgi:hypothetical protein
MKNLIIENDIIFFENSSLMIFPVVHNSPVIASHLRKSMLKYKPDIITIEQPITFYEQVMKAVKKFPQIRFLEEKILDYTNYTIIHPAEPIFEGIRTGLEIESEIIFADYPFDRPVEETDDSIYQSVISDNIDLKSLWHFGISAASKRDIINDDRIREETMAGITYSQWKKYNGTKKVMLVCGISHLIGVASNFKENNVDFTNNIFPGERNLFLLSQDSYGEILEPQAHIIQSYEESRNNNFNFEESYFKLFKDVETKYKEDVKTPVNFTSKNLFFKYSYKLALQSNRLIPSSLDMLLAARGCVDDDFSFHWYNVAATCKFAPPDGSYTKKLTSEDIGGRPVSFRFRTKIENKKRHIFRPITNSKKRQLESWKEQWKTKEESLCSFQPEDFFLESYSDKIKKKVQNQSESRHQTTTQFTGSLMDGLDLRETLKNFNTGKLYVKDHPKQGGAVDAVVFIFEKDEGDERFNYQMTWWGENEQESDMSFYSTPPGVEVIGKGISKCEYGGFMLFYPRYSLSDIWKDVDYHGLKKDEALVTAAVDHSVTGNIVLITDKPPVYFLKNYAKRQGKKLIYIPIGSLSPAKIRRLRTFHILQNHKVREYADSFIDDPRRWDNTDL